MATIIGLVADFSHLPEDQTIYGQLKRGSSADSGVAHQPRPGDHVPLALPGAIGRYRVIRRIGSGGMGVVYLAYDPALERRLALKIHRSTDLVTQPELQERMAREARAMAKLRHPNVTTIYDVEWGGTELFIAMEYIEGQTLRSWLAETQPNWRQVNQVMQKVALGLHHAHESGLVHRDLKPDNIMIDQAGEPHILDFGVVALSGQEVAHTPTTKVGQKLPAKSIRSGSATKLDTTLTSAGITMGTPAYMAPEQAEGTHIDPRTDQFAFCATWMEALLGKRLFGHTRGHCADDSTDRIDHALRLAKRRKVPTWIIVLICRGLARSRQNRYADMGELLAAFLRKQQVARAHYRLASWFAVCLVFASAILWQNDVAQQTSGHSCADRADMLAVYWTDAWQQQVHRNLRRSEPELGERAWQRLRQRMAEFQGQWVEQVGELCAGQRSSARSDLQFDLRLECLGRHREQVATLLSTIREGRYESVYQMMTMIENVSSPARCSDRSSHAQAMAVPAEPRYHPQVRELHRQLDNVQFLLDSGQASRAHQQILELSQQLARLDFAPLLARESQLLGKIAVNLRSEGFGKVHLERAVLLGRQTGQWEIAADAALQLVYVQVYLAGDSSAAQGLLQQAEALVKAAGTRPELLANLYNYKAILSAIEGDVAQELVYMRQALAAKRRAYGSHHVHTAYGYGDFALSNYHSGRLTQAIEYSQRALAMYIDIYGQDHDRVGFVLANQVVYLLMAGKYAWALEVATRALANCLHNYGEAAVVCAWHHKSLGEVNFAIGRDLAAKGHFDRLRELQTAHSVRTYSHDNEWAESYLARWFHRQGDYHQALLHAQKSLERIRQEPRAYRHIVGKSHLNLASIYHDLGQLGRSQAHLDAANAAFSKPGLEYYATLPELEYVRGKIAAGQEKWLLASRLYRQSILHYVNYFGLNEEHPKCANAHLGRATALRKQGQMVAAGRHLAMARQGKQQQFPLLHVAWAPLLVEEGLLALQLNHLAPANAAFRQLSVIADAKPEVGARWQLVADWGVAQVRWRGTVASQERSRAWRAILEARAKLTSLSEQVWIDREILQWSNSDRTKHSK